MQTPDEAHAWFVDRLIPAALPFIAPIQIHEPTVGSGVMLLAAASVVPGWANHFGIVQYHGMDVDPLCVEMACVQLKRYGLNGFGLRCAIAARGVAPLHGNEPFLPSHETQVHLPLAPSTTVPEPSAQPMMPVLSGRPAFRTTPSGFIVEQQTFEF